MKKKRVIVGMSGGVDSSVAAALLKKRGYDVIGITLQLLPKEFEKSSSCCNLGAVNDAKRVASALGIPHYTVNSRDVFQENVIDHFVDQYLNGHTPNPCVECNRSIKFHELIDKANALDADYIATGHYCKRTYSPSKNVYNLKCATDQDKDQSYFLYMLNSKQLEKILFPLGGYTKNQIRDIARDLNLINADKKDSQEICFVAGQTYKEFIEERAGDNIQKSGDILNLEGEKIGMHHGIYQYTIGQRKGLQLNSPIPLFVYKIDAKNNTIIVGPKEEFSLHSIDLEKWVQGNPEEEILGKTFDIKLRYQMAPIKGKVSQIDGEIAQIDLMNNQPFIPSGQSCVLYKNDRVVGGGIIKAGHA